MEEGQVGGKIFSFHTIQFGLASRWKEEKERRLAGGSKQEGDETEVRVTPNLGRCDSPTKAVLGE